MTHVTKKELIVLYQMLALGDIISGLPPFPGELDIYITVHHGLKLGRSIYSSFKLAGVTNYYNFFSGIMTGECSQSLPKAIPDTE